MISCYQIGNFKVKVVYLPNSLITDIEPLCSSVYFLAIGNPNPKPQTLVEYSGSKITKIIAYSVSLTIILTRKRLIRRSLVKDVNTC